MAIQFSSDLDFVELDIRLCHRRVNDLRSQQALIQPSELDWLGRKLSSILEVFDDGRVESTE